MSAALAVSTLAPGALPGLEVSLRDRAWGLIRRPLQRAETAPYAAAVREALAAARRYAAVVVTSPRAARVLADFRASGAELPRCWVSGPATAAELGRCDVAFAEPSGSEGTRSAALAAAMLAAGVPGPVLFLCGAAHRMELPRLLRAGGLRVDEVICYRMVTAPPAEAASAVAGADAVLVGGRAVAVAIIAGLGARPRPPLVALGRATAEAARDAGWPPGAVAADAVPASVAAAFATLMIAPPVA